MADVAITTDVDGFHLVLENGDLRGDEGLDTAVLISIFTDARIQSDELPVRETSRRGWWGDQFGVDQDKIGSRLWLLVRVKQTTETLRLAEDYIKESLEWLIEDGVADSIAVTAEYDANKFLTALVQIKKPNGRTSRYQLLWEKQQLKVLNGV